ncbi:unnamed protein product, partial [Symbiodinium necroappetens]
MRDADCGCPAFVLVAFVVVLGCWGAGAGAGAGAGCGGCCGGGGVGFGGDGGGGGSGGGGGGCCLLPHVAAVGEGRRCQPDKVREPPCSRKTSHYFETDGCYRKKPPSRATDRNPQALLFFKFSKERPEHQSPPKWHRSLGRRATTTQILSRELSGAKALVALSSVTLQKPTSQPSQEEPPSSAPARVVSMERLAALAVPKRRRSKSDEEAAQCTPEGAVRKPGDRPVRRAKEASGKEARAELPPTSAKPTPTPARNRAPARHGNGASIEPTTDKGKGPYPSQRAGSERSQKSPTPKPKATQPQNQKEPNSSTSVASPPQPNSSVPEDGPQSHSPLQPHGLGGVETSTSNTSFVAANQPLATEPKAEETGAEVSAEAE